jgi:hypothetical protein
MATRKTDFLGAGHSVPLALFQTNKTRKKALG